MLVFSKKAISLIFIVVVVLSVCGCSGLGTIVTSPEKQKAYDDLKDKNDRLAYYNETFMKLSDQARSIDISTTSDAETLVDNCMFAADNYIGACQDAQAASMAYRSYLDSHGSEYQYYMDYESHLSDEIQNAKDFEKILSSYKDLLNEFDQWLIDAQNLENKYNEAQTLTAPDQYYKWFMTARPVLDGYLVESDILIASVDNATALSEPGKGRESLVTAKNTILKTNTELRSQYNMLVDVYNNAYGSAYGQVSKV